MKTEVRAREETIKEKQQFLEQEIENNREQEKRIGISERVAAKIRADYQEAEASRDQFQSEVRHVFTSMYTLVKTLLPWFWRIFMQ